MKKLFALLLTLIMALGVAVCAAEEESGWTSKDLYDDDGNYIGYEEYYNGVINYKYTKQGNESHWYEYDENGNVAYYGNGKYDDADYMTESTSYDKNNQLISRYTYDVENHIATDCYYEDGKTEWVNVYGGTDGYFDLSFNADGSLFEESQWVNRTEDAYYDPDTQKWYNLETNEEVAAPDLSSYLTLAKKLMIGPAVWYANNTVGVAGISLRDEYPELTKKWYNVLPVDVSQDGTQTFPLVASNKYYMGEVTVTVDGDNVTTTYSYPNGRDYEIRPLGDCMTWFTGVDQITGDFLENPTSNMAFGTAVSRSKDLNGQDVALLFVCNRLTYRVPFNDGGDAPGEFWRNSSYCADYFKGVNALMEKMK